MSGSETIVITGGKGFLGRHLADALGRRGHAEVVALGRSDYDLTDPADADRMFRTLAPAYVVHAAAAVGGIGANVQQAGWFSYANTMMGANVVEGARRHGVRKTVLIGTVCVYPSNAPVPTPESEMFNGFPAQDTAAYGIAKRNLWAMAWAYRRQYGTRFAYLIPTNLYGPGDHFEEDRSHVIPALIQRFARARDAGVREVAVWGSGANTRDFLYVKDAAEAIAEALERYDEPDPLNLGTGVETRMVDLVTSIASAVGYEGAIRWDATKPGGAPRRCLDVTRMRRQLGLAATTTLDRGLRETVEWYTERARRA